jgi:hypothetical protein
MSSSGLARTRQARDERNKPHGAQILGYEPVVAATHPYKLLIAVILTKRRKQDAARSKSVDKHRRQFGSRGRHDYPLVGRLFGPALCAVAESADDVAQAQFVKAAFGLAQ